MDEKDLEKSLFANISNLLVVLISALDSPSNENTTVFDEEDDFYKLLLKLSSTLLKALQDARFKSEK